MHNGTSYLQILRQLVCPVKSQHRLALHTVFCIRLERYTHIGSGIDNALVQNGYLTRRIVNRVVRSLCQHHATGCYYHRTTGHVVGSQRNDISRRAFVLAYQHILILLGYQLSHSLGTIVEFAEHVFLSLRCREASTL